MFFYLIFENLHRASARTSTPPANANWPTTRGICAGASVCIIICSITSSPPYPVSKQPTNSKPSMKI